MADSRHTKTYYKWSIAHHFPYVSVEKYLYCCKTFVGIHCRHQQQRWWYHTVVLPFRLSTSWLHTLDSCAISATIIIRTVVIIDYKHGLCQGENCFHFRDPQGYMYTPFVNLKTPYWSMKLVFHSVTNYFFSMIATTT